MTTNGVAADYNALLNGGGFMELNLQVSDPELVAALSEHEPGSERHDFAVSALKIGAIALRQAQGNIDAERVRREGDRFIENMKRDLDDHQRGVTKQISDSLKEYFDPAGGRFNERVKRLVENDGEIERIIRRQIGGDGSELVNTLSAHVGPGSLLMRTIDPNAADGLIRQLADTTETTLSAQRERILSEFSLDNGDGALSRMVSELKEKHGEVGESLENRIGEVMAEFSLDKKDSALSRMVNQVETAQSQISREFSLDAEDSALARMRRELMETLDRQQRTNARFQEEVKIALADMTARKQEAEKSTRHGLAFEEAVFAFVNERSQKAGDVATATGNATGRVSRSKVGDAVIEIGDDYAASGSRIVIEAKRDASYTLARVRAELDEARKNRDAEIGLFVFSSSHIPSGLESFNRYGNDIVIAWDHEDPITDVVFDAGISVAKALCTRAKSHSDEVGESIEAIEGAILTIEKQAGGFAEIVRLTTTIKNNSENVLNRARIMSESIEKQIAVLNEKVGGLR